MTIISVTTQNIAGNALGKGRVGGKLCPLKLNVHANKPDFIILTETRHVQELQGQNIFRGYFVTQNSSSGNRNAGVVVFCRQGIEVIQNSIFNSDSGHFSVGCYNIGGTRLLLAAIYGPSTNSDTQSLDIYTQLSQQIQTKKQVYNTNALIMAGDFNLHLDTKVSKPRTCRYVEGIINQHNLVDAGKAEKIPTWRRPHRLHTKSRLDYILHSETLAGKQVKVRWSQLDHAQVTCQMEIGPPAHKKVVYKDWILGQLEFLEAAKQIIEDTLIDHSQHCSLDRDERQEVVMGRNPKDYEETLLLTDPESGIFLSHVFLVIVNKITALHRKVQKELTGKKIREMQDKQTRISEMYREVDRQGQVMPQQDQQAALQEIEQLQQELGNLAESYETAKQQRIDNFYQTNNGKNTAASFAPARPEKVSRKVSKLITSSGETTDPHEINRILQEKHKEMVSKEPKQDMELEEFLRKYQVNLPEISPDNKEALESEFLIEEVSQVLKQADSNSAPGPTGQTIAVFKYLFSMIPQTMVGALNELTFVPGLHESACFKWLKERYIIYIPKAGKEPDRPENLRPLSMLETLYKIQTRILSNRLVRTLDQALTVDQHGFRPGRSTQTCSLPFTEAIHEADRTGKPLQLLSVDIKSAFDSISPEIVRQVMERQGYPAIYLEALHGLTAKGNARVLVNSALGPEFLLRSGTGQGDPPSAPRFDIGSDPLIRAVQNVAQQYRYVLNTGRPVPISAYADDQMGALSVQTSQQVADIIQVYKDYAKVSGLEINVSKTEIMCINTAADLRTQIETDTGIRTVTGLRHLGIELRSTYQQTVATTYAKAKDKMEGKYKRINSSHADMFHKRQLITQSYLPSFSHIFMALEFDKQSGEELDKQVRTLLWTKSNKGETKVKRHMVARKRLGAGFEYGGLRIDTCESIARGLACNFIHRMINQAQATESERVWIYSHLEDLLLRIGAPPLQRLYETAGQGIWMQYAQKMQRYSPYLAFAMSSMSSLVEMNENSKDWMSASIAGHGKSPQVGRISAGEGITLAGYGITHVGQLFQQDNMTGNVDTKKNASYPIMLVQNHPWTVNKCKMLRGRLADGRGHFPPPICSFPTAIKDLKFSGLYRKMKREIINIGIGGPPSYYTRRKEGLSVPPLSEYMGGYGVLLGLGLPSRTLENSFNVLNQAVLDQQQAVPIPGCRRGGGGRQTLCIVWGNREHTASDIRMSRIFGNHLGGALGSTKSHRKQK